MLLSSIVNIAVISVVKTVIFVSMAAIVTLFKLGETMRAYKNYYRHVIVIVVRTFILI